MSIGRTLAAPSAIEGARSCLRSSDTPRFFSAISTTLAGPSCSIRLPYTPLAGVRGGLAHRHLAAAVAFVVAHLPGRAADLAGVPAARLPQRVRRDAVGHGRGEHERLESRAGLAAALQRGIELGPGGV